MLKKLKKDEENEKALQGVKTVLNGFISLRVNKKLVNKSKIGKIIGKLSKQNNADIKALAKTIKKNIITQLDEQERLKRLLKKAAKNLFLQRKLPKEWKLLSYHRRMLSRTSLRTRKLRANQTSSVVPASSFETSKGWKITLASDYSNPCLWIASKLSFLKNPGPCTSR